MTPFSMPLPEVSPIAMEGKLPTPVKPPASHELPTSATTASQEQSHHTFEKSLNEAIHDKTNAAKSEASKASTSETDTNKTDAPKTGIEENPSKADLNSDEVETRTAESKDGTEAQEEKPIQTSQKKESGEQESPHGTEGMNLFEKREQLFERLLQARQDKPLSALPEDSDHPPLSAEEMVMQLAALVNAEQPFSDGMFNKSETALPGAKAGTQPTVSASLPTLPSNGLAFLTEMLAQTQADGKVNPSTNSVLLQTVESAETSDLGLRLFSNQKGGQPTPLQSGPQLSTQSPTFADELMDRVGRMRIFSRGAGSEQVRITLIPEDLGTLDLRLRVDAQNRVHLLITAETDAARDLMSRQISQLRDALERQNMGFGDVMVHVDERGQGRDGLAQWRFGEQGEWQEENFHHDIGEIAPEKEHGAAISAPDSGLSVFA